MAALQKTDEECSAEVWDDFAEAKKKAEEAGCTFVEFDKEAFKVAAEQVAYELDGDLFSEGLYDKVRALADE